MVVGVARVANVGEYDPRDAPVILVVDDDAAGRYVIARLLRRERFAVHEAADGREALARVRARPDLVVLDVNLPDVDGFEVCRRIKADPEIAVPVVMTTATRWEDEDRRHGLAFADAYLSGFEPRDLLGIIRRLLAAPRRRHDDDR